MIIKNFVYLDTKANRLMIVQEPINNKDYVQLMDNNGADTFSDRQTLLTFCKMFCIGYVMGGGNKKPINDLNEFR
jgi:hypothetical protein